MSENLLAAEYPEQVQLREQICKECEEERAKLSSVVLVESAPDPDQRETELAAWVLENLSDCEPLELAVEACLQIEQDEAAAGFPCFRVDQLAPADLREEIAAAIGEAQATQRNKNTTGEINVSIKGTPSILA